MGRTGALMPDNHHIDLHRADIAYGILKRLSLSGTGCTGREVDHIGPHPFLGKLKREAGSGTVFTEQTQNGGIPEGGYLPDGTLEYFPDWFGSLRYIAALLFRIIIQAP